MEDTQALAGYRFLIVEDEALQACQLADMLTEMGGTVIKTVYAYEQARSAIDEANFDCVILDINLGGTLSFPLVDVLRERGLPFVVCTAYADAVEVSPGAADAPRLDKPVTAVDLRDTLSQLLNPGPRRQKRTGLRFFS
jgi:DNA-binding NtrC family response regulator